VLEADTEAVEHIGQLAHIAPVTHIGLVDAAVAFAAWPGRNIAGEESPPPGGTDETASRASSAGRGLAGNMPGAAAVPGIAGGEAVPYRTADRKGDQVDIDS
jgi:hypothetical protein